MYLAWNPKSFFRHVRPDVLRLLLQAPDVRLPLNGSGSVAEQAYRAWKRSEGTHRRQLDATLQRIARLCTTHARPFLEDLARELWGEDALQESRAWSAHDLAVCLFLADESAFDKLVESYAIDSWDLVYEYHALHEPRLHRPPSARHHVAQRMQSCFQETPYGPRCYVEDFLGVDRLVVTVFHEGELQPVDELRGDELVVRWGRPLGRVSAMYFVETKTLFVRAARRLEAEWLRDAVVAAYFGGVSGFADPLEHPRFCFEALLDPHRELSTKGEHEIDRVSLIQVVATRPHRATSSITIDLRPSLSLWEARTVLVSHGIEAPDVIGVRLLFAFSGHGRARLRTVHLQNPNTSNFDGTARDCLLRRVLQNWGLDVDPLRSMEPATLQPSKR